MAGIYLTNYTGNDEQSVRLYPQYDRDDVLAGYLVVGGWWFVVAVAVSLQTASQVQRFLFNFILNFKYRKSKADDGNGCSIGLDITVKCRRFQVFQTIKPSSKRSRQTNPLPPTFSMYSIPS